MAAVEPFCMYIFDRGGRCLLYKEWTRSRRAAGGPGQESKLLYGIITTLEGLSPLMRSGGSP